MEEKRYTFAKRYLQVKSKASYEIWCKEGRSKKVTITDAEDGDLYVFMRRDFLYSHSDTTITMCHLLFRGENLESLEIEESDFLPNFTTKAEFIEHKEDNKEYEEQNEKDKEEINKAFEEHKTEFEEHKTDNERLFNLNNKAHIEIRNLIQQHVSNYHSVKTTWSNLKELKTNSQLKPGKWYCITDYICVTNSTITTIKSGGHSFSILVLATSENTLSETAFATKPSETIEVEHQIGNRIIVTEEANPNYTHFQYCNLDAWELKYCLDNDQTRFPWCGSDDDGGKGVIYYMEDEFGNKCDYDFKNILMLRYEVTASTDSEFSFNVSRIFTRKTTRANWTVDTTNNYYFYTFSFCASSDLTNLQDLSVMDGISSKAFYGNEFYSIDKTDTNLQPSCMIICPSGSNTITLSGLTTNLYNNKSLSGFKNNTFNCLGSTSDATNKTNSFGNNCYSNTFGYANDNNLFGDGNYNNSFGDNNNGNLFGKDNYSNLFIYNNAFNLFGDGNYSNSFGMLNTYNSFGNRNNNNSFVDDNNNNSFGNNNSSNSFSNSNSSNSFGNSNSSNSFGNNNSNNSFGNYNLSNSFGNYNSSNSFGNKNGSILFNNSNFDNSFGNDNIYWKVGSSSACFGCFIGNYIQGTSSSYRTIDGKTRVQYWS